MHAQVRKKLMKKPGFVEKHGIPINQQDMIATQMAFFAAFTDLFLKIGIYISERDIDDILAVWR